MPDPADPSGHRQRLRQRFLKSGADSLADYEMLELVLFLALPRKDTKALAKTLIATFDTYLGVLEARPEDLKKVDGVGDAVVVALRTVKEAAALLAREQVIGRTVVSSWTGVLDYLRIALARETTEQFRILFLDVKNALIADEVQQRGTVNHTPVYPREVIKRALELQASAIVLVHNHPSGDPTPSNADIEMTREIADAGRPLGIAVHDHIIVARSGHTSLRALGHL